MSEALLQIKQLNVSYDGDKDVISDVSFELAPGEIVCIVGESGSGKSTLIKAIHGMSDLIVSKGQILFNGRDLTRIKGNQKRELLGTEIGLIPQDPATSFNPIRRFDVQLKEALAAHNRKDEGKAAEMLEKMGMPDSRAVLHNRPFEVSGGMNQRIAIAAAMMFAPRLLLCDEATSALDVTTAGSVVNELLRIRKEQGTAILMVTHHLGIAKRMADQIGIMKNGRIVEYGNVSRIFEAPSHEYTKNLIRDVPRLKKQK